MSTLNENLDRLLAKVAAGDLDALTPEEIVRLEEYVNADSAASAQLADVLTPAFDESLAEVAQPEASEWDSVWSGIEQRTASRGGHGRLFELWKFAGVAAACLLMLLTWRAMRPAPVPVWAMQLSDNVEVHEMEVFGDASAMISYADDGRGATMIWLFDEDEGA